LQNSAEAEKIGLAVTKRAILSAMFLLWMRRSEKTLVYDGFTNSGNTQIAKRKYLF
jgi:hypothetical protein